MTIRHLYPAVEPSLNLDFANSKKLDSRITFTRGSTATYTDESGIIRTAAQDEARFDHDSDGNSLGLLIEESRTNLTLHSEDFTNAAWSHGAETLHSANQAVAPDGTTTADLIYPNSTGFARTISQNYGNANGTYTVSVFAKAGGRNFIYVYNAQGNAKAWFNLSTGAKGSADAGITNYDIIDYGNGWYRCWVSTNSTTARYFFLGPADGDNSTEVTASGTNGIYVWGAQLEAGSFPTSYIPTSGSTVTRSADVASMTGTNFSSWYNQSEGTTVSNASTFTPTGTDACIYGYSGAGSSERMEHNAKASYQFLIYDTSGVEYRQDTANYTQNQTSIAAFAYKLNSANSSLDGTLGAEDTSVSLVTPNEINIGARFNSTLPLNGYIARLTYYPVRLPDATLQALTL
jgi:hypothetical protein